MIEIKNLYKSFNSQSVLRGINLFIEKGKMTVIMGVSGCGKSVLLKHIIGLMRPDSGEILFEGKDITKLNDMEMSNILKRFGTLFQNSALFDSMTVYDNVAFPLIEHAKKTESETKKRVSEVLRFVGLPGVENKMPSELSGGMRKRVGLARALSLEPEVILFDEPNTGLDPIVSDIIDDLIYGTYEKLKFTSVVITHSIRTAFKLGYKIALMNEGNIAAFGTPDEFKNSSDPLIKQFLAGSSKGPIKVYE